MSMVITQRLVLDGRTSILVTGKFLQSANNLYIRVLLLKSYARLQFDLSNVF